MVLSHLSLVPVGPGSNPRRVDNLEKVLSPLFGGFSSCSEIFRNNIYMYLMKSANGYAWTADVIVSDVIHSTPLSRW